MKGKITFDHRTIIVTLQNIAKQNERTLQVEHIYSALVFLSFFLVDNL